VYPLVEVVSRAAYIGKISAAVVVTNLAGFLIYRLNAREA
jgi:hypothetical protein